MTNIFVHAYNKVFLLFSIKHLVIIEEWQRGGLVQCIMKSKKCSKTNICDLI